MLAIVTSHFNPCKYRRNRENYYRFVEGLGDLSRHLFTAELLLDDDEPLDCTRVRLTQRGTRPSHCMWQKERLLNAAWRCLPPEYDMVAWVDADVTFPDASWYEQTQELLCSYRCVQLFETAEFMDASNGIMFTRHGVASIHKRRAHENGAWGIAWAARRDDVSLCDVFIAGGGDVYMGKIFMGCKLRDRFGHATVLAQAYHACAVAQKCRCIDDVSYLPVKITHMFHGRRVDRRYAYRDTLLARHRFNPQLELVKDGASYRWADPGSPLAREIRAWFERRREDD